MSQIPWQTRVESKREEKKEVRLNKFLSEAGVCSRREADRLIESGKVTIDGVVAKLGTQVSKGQVVKVGKKVIVSEEPIVVLAVNKPAGIVCTAERRERKNIISFLNYPRKITYIGRLDKESEGLLLMTNDGDIINQIMRSDNQHEKEYKVTVDKPITQDFMDQMAAGVRILNQVTRPCKVNKIGKYTFSIILTQGLNRQIRRMCEALSYQVKKLVRVRVMHIELNGLKTGTYRELTSQELDTLYEAIQGSRG